MLVRSREPLRKGSKPFDVYLAGGFERCRVEVCPDALDVRLTVRCSGRGPLVRVGRR